MFDKFSITRIAMKGEEEIYLFDLFRWLKKQF